MTVELLDVFEAAASLRKHPQTIRKWLKDGTLPCQLIGRRKYVRAEDIVGFLDASYDDSGSSRPEHPRPVQPPPPRLAPIRRAALTRLRRRPQRRAAP